MLSAYIKCTNTTRTVKLPSIFAVYDNLMFIGCSPFIKFNRLGIKKRRWASTNREGNYFIFYEPLIDLAF